MAFEEIHKGCVVCDSCGCAGPEVPEESVEVDEGDFMEIDEGDEACYEDLEKVGGGFDQFPISRRSLIYEEDLQSELAIKSYKKATNAGWIGIFIELVASQRVFSTPGELHYWMCPKCQQTSPIYKAIKPLSEITSAAIGTEGEKGKDTPRGGFF